MKHFRRYLYYVLLILAVSCTDDEKPADIGRAYLPLQVGAYREYNINEIIYTLGQPETTAYQLRIKIVDKFLSNTGDSTFVMHRSRRNTSADVWTFVDTWSARSNNREAVLSEGNVSYVILKFPVLDGLAWEGNAYNTLGQNIYTMKTNTPATIGDKVFDDCITIVQGDNKDYIVSLDDRREIYARGVGLVSREVIQLQYCTAVDCLGKQQVESGVILKQVIQDYGVE